MKRTFLKLLRSLLQAGSLFTLGLFFFCVRTDATSRQIVQIVEPDQALLTNAFVVDARAQKLYEESHLPGAVHFDWSRWTLERPYWSNYLFGTPSKWGTPVSDLNALKKRLQTLGLKQKQTILVYGSPKGSWGEEGRVVWNFLYWGAEHVLLLNGGFPAWKKKGLPVSSEKVTPSKGSYEPKIVSERLASLENIKGLAQSKSLVDVRTPAEHTGEEKYDGQKRAGHIGNSVFFEFSNLYRDDQRFITQKSMEAALKDHRLKAAYCTGGVRSALFSVLYEAYFGRILPNYAPGMWEWSAHPKLKLTREN